MTLYPSRGVSYLALAAKYQGFCTHEPPVPGPPVIMHGWNEVKEQLVAPFRDP
jgi:hypothetical protein